MFFAGADNGSMPGRDHDGGVFIYRGDLLVKALMSGAVHYDDVSPVVRAAEVGALVGWSTAATAVAAVGAGVIPAGRSWTRSSRGYGIPAQTCIGRSCGPLGSTGLIRLTRRGGAHDDGSMNGDDSMLAMKST
mmetsp:Transcript_10173/g.20450  ORF Transcript_10173/g.20450 Transcript_10173/m.20450 type:complete len:133 (+) Transcript_10173:511-909(+)